MKFKLLLDKELILKYFPEQQIISHLPIQLSKLKKSIKSFNLKE